MSHNRAISITVLFALMILVSLSNSTSVSAVPYNTTDNSLVFPNAWAFPYCQVPIDPKIACSESNPDMCILAYYEAGGIGCTNGVRAVLSLDGFQTPNECVGGFLGGVDQINCFDVGSHTIDWSAWALTQKPNYHLPFDVVWSGKSGGNVSYDAFYIAVEDTVYRYLRGVDTGGWCDGCAKDMGDYFNTFVCGGTSTCREHTDFWTCGWDSEDVENMLACGGGYHEGYNTPNKDKYAHSATAKWNISTGASTYDDYSRPVASASYCLCQDGTAGCPATWYTSNVTYYSGPMESGYDFAHQARIGSYNVWTAGACSITGGNAYNINNFTEPSGIDSSQHEFHYNLYTMNITSGILSHIITGDYASIGSGSLVYTHDSSIDEVINWSDSEIATGTSSSREYIAWYRSSNSTGNGVYVYQDVLDTIVLSVNPSMSANAELVCADQNYSSSAVSDAGLIRLSTPCSNDENNTITVFAPFEPTTYTFNVSFNSTSCASQYLVNMLHWEVPFDTDFEIRSLHESGIVVANATVTLSGHGSGQTDSFGRVTISNVNPLTNIGMRAEQVSTCVETLSLSADVLPVLYTVSKTGYKTYTDNSFTMASYTDAGTYDDWSFVTSNVTRIEVTGTLINVSLETAEGIYVEPCGYYVEMSGANNSTRRSIGGAWTTNSSSTRFPVLFRLEDNRSYWDETISVLAPDGSWHNKTVNLTADETYDIPEGRVIIEKSLSEFPCDRTCDCPTSTCIGNYHYSSSGCVSGVCDYNVQYCDIACDTLAGCYHEDTTTACLFDTDCPSTCLTDYAMEYGLCGADGFCKNITQECTTFCNTTANFCEELRSCRFGETFDMSAWVYVDFEKFTFFSGTHTCDITNTDSIACLGGPQGQSISKTSLELKGKTIADVNVEPYDLTYTTTVDDAGITWYNFSSATVVCDESCGYTYTVCDGGCDSESGECLNPVGSIEGTIYNLLPSWLHWVLTGLFLWTMLSLIIGAVLTYIPTKISPNAQPTPQFGMAGMFVMYMIGIPLGYVDPFIGLIIVIGIGLYLAKMISSTMAGG